MSDIFICYARSDSAFATKVAAFLRTEGWSVFLDVQTQVGQRWDKAIEKELQAAKAVVALWSAASRESDFVLEEAEYGKRKNILFPAFIEAVETPYGFGRIQTANLGGWDGESEHSGLDRLKGALSMHLQRDAEVTETRVTHVVEEPMPVRYAVGQAFRDQLKEGGEGPLMVVIPAGRFMMGSPRGESGRSADEGPQHEVRIAASFAMGAHTITFADYDRFCDSAKREKVDDGHWGRGTRPVINVSWNDAQAYCAWLSAQTGRSYRLPSEAEWEYACRARTDTPFYFGVSITSGQANFKGRSAYNGSPKDLFRSMTTPVGSFAANAFGLFDMHGNVWEWCQDPWHESYKGAPTDGSVREQDPKMGSRVLRGGSWNDIPLFARAANRNDYDPGYARNVVGFRVCAVAPIE